MRGLAFPLNAVYARDASYDREHGTPQSNNVDAIPIDPALSGTAIDPAITGEESGINEISVSTSTNCTWFDARDASCHTRAMTWPTECMSDYLFV